MERTTSENLIKNCKGATCPICKQKLAEKEYLIAYWYAPKNWWVLCHQTIDTPKYSATILNQLNSDDKSAHTICAMAGFQFFRDPPP